METNTVIEHLIAVLHREANAAAMLETLLKQKRRAFVQWHNGELLRVVAEEEGVLSTLALLEKERTVLVKELTGGSGGTIRQILSRYPSKELEQAYRELRAISARVLRWSGQNGDLVASSLSFVRRTLGFITGNFRNNLLDQKV